jgi:hypothetical protein
MEEVSFIETPFDVILNNKKKELDDLYNLKTKCKKMTSNVNDINFMDKQLYNKINAAINKKNKDSKNYKKKNDETMFSVL